MRHTTVRALTLRRLTGAVIVFLILAAACGRSERTPFGEGYHGVRPNPPFPKPDFTLASTDGTPFHFRQATKGYVTLLFFGYTHCPDVCPVHMANIAAVLHRLGPEVANQVKVVFVTTDPERDTPERLREWLGKFDPKFIGLGGPIETVNRIQASIQLDSAARAAGPDSSYTVDHSAMVLAYTRDDSAHFVYPFGMRQEDWADDLPKLVKE